MAADDDILTGPVPDPDAEPTAAERAHARTFADLVEKTLAGRTPPAMSAEDRALLEAATVIRATSGGMELSATTQHAMIEDVLAQALRQAAGGAGAPSPRGVVTPIHRGRAKRWAPWAVAATSLLVAAAAIVLWLRAPQGVAPTTAVGPAAALPTSWTSRPTDPMIGPIPRERSGDASSRIDYIFADRLDGYRERSLQPRPSRSTTPTRPTTPRGGTP